MSTTYPYPLILTCTKTGKQAKWLNRKIIEAKIAKFGSLEAFLAQYVSKGAGGTGKNQGSPRVAGREGRTWGGQTILGSPSAPRASLDTRTREQLCPLPRMEMHATQWVWYRWDGTVGLVKPRTDPDGLRYIAEHEAEVAAYEASLKQTA